MKKSTDWRGDFIQFGGFDQLLNIFQQYVQKDNLNPIEKNILLYILKIIKNYLTAALATKYPHIYKIANYARLQQYTLDTIDENLTEAERESAL